MDASLLENGINMNFIDRMSHLYDRSQKKATKKLIIASIICIIFMIIEIIAAIISNSLSLMTDASHLFCDLLSFALNLFSIYVSTFEGNVDMSFGYHRAEIIGALFSIFFIWALSAYILYSAVFRLFEVQTVDGYIMFVTAFVSTLANIFIAFVLKVHSHGFEFIGQRKCSHSDGSSEHTNHLGIWGNDTNNVSKNGKYKNINSDIVLVDDDQDGASAHAVAYNNNNISIGKINTSSCSYVAFDYYENVNKINKYNHHQGDSRAAGGTGDEGGGGGSTPNMTGTMTGGKYTQNVHQTILNSSTSHFQPNNEEDVDNDDDNFKVGINDYVHKSNGTNDMSKKKKKKKNSHSSLHEDRNTDCNNSCTLSNQEREENAMYDSNGNQSLEGTSLEVGDHLTDEHRTCVKHDHSHRHSHDHSHGHSHNHRRKHSRDNGSDVLNSISLKTAYLHAISDLLQNIGVMIASLIIWYNPKYSITDPICSIIFCFIVFSTTISVIKEILNVLMEGTPVSINLIDIKNDLLKIPGVIDVHDLHVWSLSIGKPALACHIVAHKNFSHTVLNNATLLCQNKYKILHTTVQTDYPSNISNCETYAHLKCSNLKTETQK
ncbi:cation diffusion facilitator transporter domain containing protein [Plasmodium gonderi]|uniref:Cation diffusion facilitator transporter domain containing protein n=1 Tax=Plasmodium gonderi TaxID=77519 RepID=A0A1Y1JPP7_PLAGO|nr:cation diffusion facilitator transporter domain containing protein [Plasmodium gonderi]GAW83445.1 cation diffusion facilitator transporter domain containing protein [Plasmodium gonderi]